MYNLYRVSNLAVWLQQINKLYLLTPTLYKSSVHVTRGNDMRLEKSRV